ncbi:MAG: methylated-DNA-[protein]-cysteine S-methyltransferase [Gaiellaceae bacterium]|nr:methylated-DNA-[protein]-cysteine S-methyltransferase [Gaiellaceae bacterium]
MRATLLSYVVPGWGVGEVWLADGRVVGIEHPVPGREGEQSDHELARRLSAWFGGAPDDFAAVELDLEWCTPFERQLVDALRGVPAGATVSYGELAALAGRPRAARAAGTFCANNRFAIVVPCHRVVAANGIGGYGSLGVAYKRRLLALEKR